MIRLYWSSKLPKCPGIYWVKAKATYKEGEMMFVASLFCFYGRNYVWFAGETRRYKLYATDFSYSQPIAISYPLINLSKSKIVRVDKVKKSF